MFPPGTNGSRDQKAGQRTLPGFLAPTRLPLTLLALVVVSIASWAVPALGATPAKVRQTQRLAALLVGHEAFARPAGRSAQVALVASTRPLTRERTMLPILRETRDAAGTAWLDVELPGRPNGQTGWIRESGTRVSTTRWQLVVDISSRELSVYYNGFRVLGASVIVGKPSTPTPTGRFFVEESIRLGPTDAGAPFALALSARSNVLQEFDGGPGQIALHGLDNVGGELGTAASHGCVRVADDTIRWLAARIGPGVPVTITT